MGGYCVKENRACEFANNNGYCSVSACIKTGNITTSPNRDNGLYAQLFAVKDGVRYDMKVVSLGEMTTILTNSLMDGIEKLCT